MRPEICEASLLSSVRLDLRRLKNGYAKMFEEFDQVMALPAKERADRLELFMNEFKGEKSQFFDLDALAERIAVEAEDGKIYDLQRHAIHDAASPEMVDEFNLDGLHPDYAGALEAIENGHDPVGTFDSEHEKLAEFGHKEGDF